MDHVDVQQRRIRADFEIVLLIFVKHYDDNMQRLNHRLWLTLTGDGGSVTGAV
jgi:hypothetical protein